LLKTSATEDEHFELNYW